MQFLSLSVADFGCVDRASLQLGPGLNVLYGPNDLGKSTLAHAIRAALLLLPRSSIGKEFKPWHSDGVPRVVLEFRADDGRIYRLDKSFGGGTRGQATLHWSNDGRDFQLEAQGRAVDGRVRELLGWGLPPTGGRAGARGLPDSFLATVLLGRQAQPGTVFEASLDTDADESARARLTTALQALAQDPQFKEILERAQIQVDLAYRQDGTPRKHKDSPFRKIADRIVQLSDELRQLQDRVHDSDDVRSRLAELYAQRDEALAARDEARDALAAARTDLLRAQARAHAVAARDTAAGELATIRAKVEALAQRRDALHAATEALPAATATCTKSEAAVEAAAETLRRALSALEAATEGGDASERLERQSRLTRQAQAKTAVQQADEQVRRLRQGHAVAERVTELRAGRDDQLRQLERARQVQADAETTRRGHEVKRRRYDAAIALRRLEDAQAERTRAKAAAERVTELQRKAEAARAQATEIDAALARRDLPDAATLAELVELHAQLQLARARLGGGLAVAVRLQRAGAVTIHPDDDVPASHAGATVEAKAERRLRIAIDGVGEIDVLAGGEDARAEVESLQARWQARAEPRLQALGLPDLEGLRAAVDDAEARRAQADEARRRADADTALADVEGSRADELGKWETAVVERERALGGLDRSELAAQVEGLSEEALHRKRVEAETAIAEARARVDAAAQQLAQLQASVDAKSAELDAASETLTQARREAGGDPTELLGPATDRLAAAEGALEEIDDELLAFEAQRADAKRTAEDAFARAQVALQTARDRHHAATERRTAIDRDIAGHRAAIEVAEQDVAALDEPTARATLAEREAALAALPAPTTHVSEADVAAGEATLEDAEGTLREVEAQLRKSEGALQSVGGSVVRDKAEETRMALDQARRTEDEIALDYQGWRMLVETLRETENEEGRNLGDALVGPVSEQLAVLTAGRYEAVDLGPDLRAHGVEVAGAARDVDDFSEGIQEQLATLLRLTIARQLGSALVLDDHLTQTDPERIAWFRDVLRNAGDTHQVVVLTCRPRDYLRDEEMPNGTSPVREGEGLRAVDLGRVITRARVGSA